MFLCMMMVKVMSSSGDGDVYILWLLSVLPPYILYVYLCVHSTANTPNQSFSITIVKTSPYGDYCCLELH